MVRGYVRKRSVPPPCEEILKKALSDVLRGVHSIRQAAEKYGLSKSTVGRYAKIHHRCGLLVPPTVKSGNYLRLPANMEVELVTYLKCCALLMHGLTTTEIRQLAFSFASSNLVRVPRNWEESEKASIEWLHSFMKRHTTLSTRKPEPTSQAQAAAFNKPVVMSFNDKFLIVESRYKLIQTQSSPLFRRDKQSHSSITTQFYC